MKKIDLGKTQLTDLYKILKYDSQEQLESRRARLFPHGNSENEIATSSIFLASLGAIKEYREELLTQIEVKKITNQNAKLHVYTEIEYDCPDDRPDGLIIVTTGKKEVIEWAALVEVKVRDNMLEHAQIERYANFGRNIGIHNIITISNYLTTTPLESPISLKYRSFNLYHWSWTYLKVTASRLIRNNMVEDDDHIFILSELRRYFDAHKNLKDFTRMKSDWKDATAKLHTYNTSQNIDPELLSSIVDSYKQEEKDISLQMTDKTEFHVQLITKANKDRQSELEDMLKNSKIITSEYMLNGDKKNVFSIEVDFIRQRVKCFTQIKITKGKAVAQTSTLLKMFDGIAAPDDMLVNAIYIRKKTNNNSTSLSKMFLERDAKEGYSILDSNYGDEVVDFEIKSEDSFGNRDFQGVSNFVSRLENIVERFITQVMENKK